MNNICFVKKKVNLLVEKCNCDTWNWYKEEHNVQNTAYLWNKINLSLEACFLFFSNNSGFVCMHACVCLCVCCLFDCLYIWNLSERNLQCRQKRYLVHLITCYTDLAWENTCKWIPAHRGVILTQPAATVYLTLKPLNGAIFWSWN